MQVFTYSEAGHDHQNEDAIFAEHLSCGVLVCLLADGQGGQPGGKEASQCAVKNAWGAIGMPKSQLKDIFFWCETIAEVDEFMSEYDAIGFTTLIALGATENCIYGASVGDSMALLIKSNEILEITARQNKIRQLVRVRPSQSRLKSPYKRAINC